MDNKVIFEKIDNAQKILIGIGNGFSKDCDNEKLLEYYNHLARLIEGKDYFVVSISSETYIKQSSFDLSRVAIPLDKEVAEEVGEKQWNEYTNWLQHTLNKDMLVLELGVGFDMPTLVRWPFEKIATLNNKAFLCRVNELFPQLPDDMGNKGISIKQNVGEYIETLYDERYGN